MVILVTGGAGYVGSNLITELLKKGEEVVSVDNLYRGDYRHLAPYSGKPSLKMCEIDISSAKSLEESLGNMKISCIVHLAAVPGLRRCSEDPERAVLTNILGTFNILELAKKKESKVIFASGAAVFGVPKTIPIVENHVRNPINLYGFTKLAGENLVKSYYINYNLRTIILRFGNIYGVGVYTYWENIIPKFIKLALEEKPVTIYGNGEQGRDYIHVKDVTSGILSAILEEDLEGETFNLASSKSYTVNQIADILQKTIQEEYDLTMKREYHPARPGEPYIHNFKYSTSKIRKALGFKPQWTIKKGIKQTAKYYMDKM